MLEIRSDGLAAHLETALSFGPLVTPQDLDGADGAGIATYDVDATGCLARMARHVVEVLNAPHADLGRPGVVCPFTTEAVNRASLLLAASTIVEGEDQRLAAEMAVLRDLFHDASDLFKPSVPEIYRAIVFVFPRLGVPAGAEMIERVQKALKPSYLERGLMIGEFYPGCPARGLHNPAFRPFHTPLISLAIRHMTLFDAPFMVQDERYVAAYCKRFGEAGEKRIRAIRDGAGKSKRRTLRRHGARLAS